MNQIRILIKLIGSMSGGDCQVDENGLISNQRECRFVPSATEQTATTSLMGFHWLDSVPCVIFL